MPFGHQINAFYPSLLADIRRQDAQPSALVGGTNIEPTPAQTKKSAKAAQSELMQMVMVLCIRIIVMITGVCVCSCYHLMARQG